MRPGTATIKVEDACNKVKNVLDSLGGESTYQNYVVNVSVGEDGEEKLCVMEYGARRTSWLKENIGWPEVVAYTSACTATTLA